jgi:hypothetical protein
MDSVPHEHFFRNLDFFNKEIVILTDPKAISQPYQTDAYNYVKSVNGKKIIEEVLGNGLVVAECQDHKVGFQTLIRVGSNSVLVPKEAPRSSV